MDQQFSKGRQTLLATEAIATGTAADTSQLPADRTFQATVAGTGAVTATAIIEVSNDKANWITAGTITLSGTTSASDGFASQAPWAFTRGRVSAISGTGAVATVTMGV